MSTATVLDNVIKGNAAEIELLNDMREGSAKIIDGLISEAFKRKLQLEHMKELAVDEQQIVVRRDASPQGSLDQDKSKQIQIFLKYIMTVCSHAQDNNDAYFEAIRLREHKQAEHLQQGYWFYAKIQKGEWLQDIYKCLSDKMSTIYKNGDKIGLLEKYRYLALIWLHRNNQDVSEEKPSDKKIRDQERQAIEKAWKYHQNTGFNLREIVNAAEKVAELAGLELDV